MQWSLSVLTVVENKVTKRMSEKTAAENDSRCSQRAPLNSVDTKSGELSWNGSHCFRGSSVSSSSSSLHVTPAGVQGSNEAPPPLSVIGQLLDSAPAVVHLLHFRLPGCLSVDLSAAVYVLPRPYSWAFGPRLLSLGQLGVKPVKQRLRCGRCC